MMVDATKLFVPTLSAGSYPPPTPYTQDFFKDVNVLQTIQVL